MTRPLTASATRGAVAPPVEVLDGGPFTTVQDLPGRLGYWHVGVPPNGPMDDLVAPAGRTGWWATPTAPPALELTGAGPTLRFTDAAIGRDRRRGDAHDASTARPVAPWTPVAVPAGAVVRGRRARRARACGPRWRVRGGIDVAAVPRQPLDLHARRLRRPRGPGARRPATCCAIGDDVGRARRPRCRPGMAPVLRPAWRIGVLVGPHAAPEFLTAGRPRRAAAHRVGGALQLGPHRRAAGRAPARRGPGPTAARPACTRRTSTTPATPSARSTSPATCRSSSGPTGRASAGSSARPSWRRPSGGSSASCARATRCGSCRGRPTQAAAADRRADDWLAGPPHRIEPLARPVWNRRRLRAGGGAGDAVLARDPATGDAPEVTYRQAGDRFLLVEYGADDPRPRAAPAGARPRAVGRHEPPRPRAWSTPPPACARCCVQVDGERLTVARRWRAARAAEDELADVLDEPVPVADRAPAAVVGRPGHPRGHRALHARRAGRRAVVPVEHRVHPADQRPRLASTTCAASCSTPRYLVLGLGDVYLGAPVATPLDPRHRLVTTKYNPARTWTAENSVGIGGAYLCIYGMEGPGGYQFVGRTVQVWNRDAAGRTSSRAVAVADLRPAAVVPGRGRRAARACAPAQAAGRAGDRHRGHDVPPGRHRRVPRRPRGRHRARSGPASGPPSPTSGPPGPTPASSHGGR